MNLGSTITCCGRFSIVHRILLGCIASAVAVLLLPIVAHAQSTGTVSGVVSDAANHAPMKGAIAMLADPADSAAKPLGDVTDEKGAFTIQHVVPGKVYRLEVRYAGYETRMMEHIVVTAEQPTRNVGEIVLTEHAVMTPGVEVTAPREMVSIRADKTVYGVENNPVYTATNVSELLAQIPSVQVDQDGKVSLRGNDNVTIMMNDRPLSMPRDQLYKFLQSLPASIVKDIEVRTNPGAQFDAKNQGGIINILTRRSMSDVIGGNVNVGADTRKGFNGGLGLYYNGNDLNASLTGGLYHGPGTGSSSSLRLNYLDSIERRNDAVGTSTSESNSWYGFGQADYNFGEHDLASISFNGNHWSSDYASYGVHNFFTAAGVASGRFYDTNAPLPNSNSGGGYSSGSFLFKHTFAKDHKLSLDVNYDGFSYDGSSSYISTYLRADGSLDSARSTSRTDQARHDNTTIITSLDYENSLSDQFKLTFGAKNERNNRDENTLFSNLDRATGEFVLDSTQTNHYLPKNTIYALYGETVWSPIEGFSIQAGLRLERANVSAKFASGAEVISKDYTDLFPSGSLSYTIAQQHTFTLSFRRSVALPDVGALNPVKVKFSDLSVYSGNSDLVPEFTQMFQLSYNTFWGMGNMISLSPYYSTTDGNIENSVQLVNGVSYTQSENFNGTYSIGTELSFSMRPFDWLNFRLSGSAYREVNRGSAIPGDIYSAAAGYNGSASFSADLMKGLTFSSNFFGNLPPTVGGNQNGGYVFWSFSLRQKLLDDKLSLSLKVNDPFDLQHWHSIYSGPNFYTESTSKWSQRYIGLNLSYNFGKIPRMESHRQEKEETKGSGGSGGGSGGGGGGQ